MFEGTATQMHHSLQKLANLPAETLVYCGHEYTVANLKFAIEAEPDNAAMHDRLSDCLPLREQNLPTLPSTIGLENKTNPFLRVSDPEAFAAMRKWKNNF